MSSNAVSFFNMFTSYLLLYVISIACIIGAVFAGIALRKKKNAKEEALKETETAAAE